MAGILVDELNAGGHHAMHLAAWSSTGFGGTRMSAYGPQPLRTLTGLAHKVSRKAGLGDTIPFELPVLLSSLIGRYDLVHFHDTSSTFSPATLNALSRFLPVVWTFHDCSPFTGGCIYPQMHGCERYRVPNGCGNCPAKGEWPLDGRLDTTKQALRMRRRAHASERLRALAPSSWMADLAESSGNVRERPLVVPNTIETDIFTPSQDVKALRARLDLPLDRPVLITSAGNLNDPRKGVRQAISAAKLMRTAPVLVLLGAPDGRTHELTEGVDVIATGYVSDRVELAEWYQASDAFMFCSAADNQPLAILEALSCGTPVHGWATGGAPEMLSSSAQGRLLPYGDETTLASDLDAAMVVPQDRELCRRQMIEKFSRAAFVSNHLAVYRSMTSIAGRQS